MRSVRHDMVKGMKNFPSDRCCLLEDHKLLAMVRPSSKIQGNPSIAWAGRTTIQEHCDPLNHEQIEISKLPSLYDQTYARYRTSEENRVITVFEKAIHRATPLIEIRRRQMVDVDGGK